MSGTSKTNTLPILKRHTIHSDSQPRINGISYLQRDSEQHAPKLHFAHATGFNGQTYSPLFAQIDPGISIYAMDMRGHGQSNAPANPNKLHSWHTYEKDLIAFIDQLGEPLFLAGHSIGAAVSIAAAAARPEQVKGLILLEPVILPPAMNLFMTTAKALKLGHKLPIAEGAKNRTARFPSKAAAIKRYTGRGAFKSWPEEWIRNYVEGGTKESKEGLELSCKPEWEAKTFSVTSHQPWQAIKKLQCPVTLLKGKNGSTCMMGSLNKMKALHPHNTYQVFNDASHFLPMEYTDICAKEINQFILSRAIG
ncbi:MAG: alpha/beta hydrolase [Pseudomonadales bacterium]|nr:alpha/beta hydrolase [Pseudomonadales bacterium]